MAPTTNVSRSVRARTRSAVFAAAVAAGAAGAFLVLPAGLAVAADPVPLGTAGTFAVLAGAGVTNTGATTLNGDLGTYPTPTVTGSASLTVTGTDHGAGGVTQGAKTDLDIAYGVAAGAAATAPVTGDLAGRTLPAGVYNSASSIGLTGVLTLDGENDPDAVFIFQAGSTLTTASGSRVALIRGADPCNVFWQVGSSATLGTGSTFVGSILALTDITLTTNAVVDGRVLAREGAVTLDSNTVTVPLCGSGNGPSASATPSTGGPTASATPTGGGAVSATPSGTATDAVPAPTTPVATPAARPAAPGAVVAAPAVPPRQPAGGTARRNGAARRQVRSVPSGGVAAGDGSAHGSGGTAPVTAALVVAAGVAVAGCARPLPRRHR